MLCRVGRRFNSFKKQTTFVQLGKKTEASNSYSVGQHFLHDKLNYRGLVLFEIPHSRYTYDEKSQDYVLNDEVKYMALVDQRDIPTHETHLVQDIFKDAMLNLRNVDGFDIVDPREIRPFVNNPFEGYDQNGLPLRSKDAFDFDNYWYKKFIYDFDGEAKETGNLLKWKNDYFNYETLSTFERTCWPEGIKVSISPVFLAYNSKTQILGSTNTPEIRIGQFEGVYYKIKRHNFTWQGDDTNQQIETGPGLNVGSDFIPGSPNLRRKRNIGSITLTPENPIFKFTSSTMLPQPNALFFGNLLIKDHRGREFMLPLPSFNLNVDQKKLEIEKLLQQVEVPPRDSKVVNLNTVENPPEDIPTHKPSVTKNGNATIVTGVKLTKKDPKDSNANNDNDKKK
ncbi:Oidioi.mRNA.OKI2018_I69.PAR.g13011.t1.cds [Oikopleura dioica]|uniref:Oidioi.mRNA.OKI2018_I69.PAR.g13011.t1.cds n=1 Tax=Oikopleura dioica TaxID=34765 RepID=A0ABN7S5Y6_OIKDI|nr:Oidioi.mRNA.OKI2018_I69.PAR.g13011.t1.cds [Oikopleura dioica]